MKTYEYDSQDELSFVLQLFTCIYFFIIIYSWITMLKLVVHIDFKKACCTSNAVDLKLVGCDPPTWKRVLLEL